MELGGGRSCILLFMRKVGRADVFELVVSCFPFLYISFPSSSRSTSLRRMIDWMLIGHLKMHHNDTSSYQKRKTITIRPWKSLREAIEDFRDRLKAGRKVLSGFPFSVGSRWLELYCPYSREWITTGMSCRVHLPKLSKSFWLTIRSFL